MTLWDKQPLTADEVAAREMCECQHPASSHSDAYHGTDRVQSHPCTECDCEDLRTRR